MKPKLALVALLSVYSVANSSDVLTQDDNAGRNLASACASCHGTNGHSVGGIEHLAGVPQEVIVEKFRAFRSGAKPATVMHQIAKGYNDQQLELIAAYFAGQK